MIIYKSKSKKKKITKSRKYDAMGRPLLSIGRVSVKKAKNKKMFFKLTEHF